MITSTASTVLFVIAHLSFLSLTTSAQDTSHSLPTRFRRETPNETTLKNCLLPPQPLHGAYVSPTCQSGDSRPECHNTPGSPVPTSWLLKYSCDQDYNLISTSKFSVCDNGIWLNEPTCMSTHECNQHENCASDQACVNNKCSDPCLDRCGANTLCKVSHHIPTCACKEGFTGNPLEACQKQDHQETWPPRNAGKKKFVTGEGQVNWVSAKQLCKIMNCRLASIKSAEEREEAKKIIAMKGDNVWIGGYKKSVADGWYWVSTGEKMIYTSWNKGEPNNAQKPEDCIDVSPWNKFNWNDSICSDLKSYLCECY